MESADPTSGSAEVWPLPWYAAWLRARPDRRPTATRHFSGWASCRMNAIAALQSSTNTRPPLQASGPSIVTSTFVQRPGERSRFARAACHLTLSVTVSRVDDRYNTDASPSTATVIFSNGDDRCLRGFCRATLIAIFESVRDRYPHAACHQTETLIFSNDDGRCPRGLCRLA